MNPVVIKLTYAQISMAAHVAVMRRTSNMMRQVAAKRGTDNNGEGVWDIEVNSCCAELAVALHLNLFWCGAVNDFKARDVGGLVDVRSRSRESYDLILQPDDHDGVPYVHAWTHLPLVTLWGWMYGREGKQERWWKDPAGGRPAFFVPKEELRDMSTLHAWVLEYEVTKVSA